MRLVQNIDRFFGIRSSGSSFAIETRAGITTFVTMAYILFVNPSILSKAIVLDGKDLSAQLLVTTALASGIGSWLMAFIARYPFALAPGMGTNAYFAFAVVLGMGIPWQTALGAVFISGILFVILSLLKIREAIVNIFPASLKLATTAGIGLFLALLGFENSDLVVKHDVTLVTMGDLQSPQCIVSLFGLIVTMVLLVKKVRGAILIGILATTVFAIFGHFPLYDGAAFPGWSGSLIRAPQWPTDLFFALNIKDSLSLGLASIVFVFLFVDFFDTAGTLVGLQQASESAGKKFDNKRMTHAFLSDALATVFGALLGTSTTTCYVESAAGVEDGGRTGFTAFIVGLLFFLSIFFWPLLGVIPKVATAPALILVGFMMVGVVKHIAWEEWENSLPAFFTLFMIPLTFSIANGITFGILSYVAIRLLTGKFREIHPILYIISAMLLARFVFVGS